MVHETYEGVGRGFLVQLMENMYRFSLGAVAGGECFVICYLAIFSYLSESVV